ncbi:LysR family transcriptional regulator [Mumia zhuanghuii]|uniref:LysR substrate-binding domain-containing protein n=2 Tax=Mumia TaxID=1546255 RepID=A0ABW1QNK5_9ACTN|nr:MULTISPECIES: LysR family transcriptional regulator [Mumia]KAA1423923.1 LysR family transcriptional regulator [Mumia zhuanghuii]
MELREIEVFLVLSDELHFGRTAERLFITQSRVSQTVRAMESRIGGRLFDRTSRRVALTPLGVQLRDEVRPAYDELRRAVAHARETATGVSGVLRICVPTYSMAGLHFTTIVREFQRRFPACRLTVTEEFPGDFERLRDGAFDVMCQRHPIDEPDLTVGATLSVEERVLLVRAGHPLTAKSRVDAEDLADYSLIQRSGIPRSMYDEFWPATTPSGRPIARGPAIATTSDVLQLVARGEIVHPTVSSFSTYYRHPEVVEIPLDGFAAVRSMLVWVTDHETSSIRALDDLAREIVGDL